MGNITENYTTLYKCVVYIKINSWNIYCQFWKGEYLLENYIFFLVMVIGVLATIYT